MIINEKLSTARILIIDDNAFNVQLLEAIVKEAGYDSVLSITDPRKAKDLYLAYKPDLVLLDISMPYLDGFQVMEQFKEIESSSYIPVLVLTALQDNEIRLKVLESGAQDFLTKPFNRVETLLRIKNLLTVRLLHQRVKRQNEELEQKVRERTEELNKTRLEIIRRLGRAAEYKDNETGLHIIRMSKISARLGELAGLGNAEVELILNTSPMHDIGKIAIPDAILLKSGPLDAKEWEKMQTHTTMGHTLLDGHESKLMIAAREIALTHHEKWNGQGYPQGLKNNEIPFNGRIVGLADVFDALTAKRPYKDPYPISKAIEIIKSEREKHFDPELTDLFLENIEDFVIIKNAFTEVDSLVNVDEYKLSARDLAVETNE